VYQRSCASSPCGKIRKRRDNHKTFSCGEGAQNCYSDCTPVLTVMKLLQGTLKTKFILAFALILALLTFSTLLLVQYRVQVHVREDIAQGLRNSVVTFQQLQQLRESTLERSAALLATLPPLKALMTSQDIATIQEASGTFWNL